MAVKQTLDKINTLRKAATQTSRKRKLLLYGVGALLLVGVIGYFVRQFNVLLEQRQMGLEPPARQERLDSTASKQAALTRLYELEEKNRYRDSMTLAQEEKALDYIVMDWENLYDVRKKKVNEEPQPKAQAPDSLNLLLELLKSKDSTRLTSSPGDPKEVVSNGTKRKGSNPVRKTIARRKTRPEEKQIVQPSAPADPFNTVRAPGYPTAGHASFNASYTTVGNGNTASSQLAAGSLLPAVVHGEHKVKQGGKVTFRTLEEATVNGTLLPKNTLLTGIADFNQGRITFAGFRARVAGSSLVLPFTCYDSDMMAGISFEDQSVVESEVRRGAVTSLTNAAADLSSSIPYGSLARATSNIARGAIRGSARSRGQFIYLSDGYKVFLELQPPK